MKNLFAASCVVVCVFVGSFLLLQGCEGPKGDQGPTGPQGPGYTASDECGTCHSVSTLVLAKQIQYQLSGHATGTAYTEGNNASCAACHSSEGFRMKIAGMTVTAIDNPTPVNCRTCHNIHQDYAESDFELSTTAPVELTGIMYNGTTVDIGKGNLCANCHQTRARNYGLTYGGPDVKIDSRFGPHHGTQTNYFVGSGGYEVVGSLAYTNSPHTTNITDGCPTCHMPQTANAEEGGHSLIPTVQSCKQCHADITSIESFRGAKTEIDGLMTQLRDALVAKGLLVLNSTTGAYSPANGKTATADKAGALLNYQGLVDDGSFGIHNTQYIRAMLTNSIEAVNR